MRTVFLLLALAAAVALCVGAAPASADPVFTDVDRSTPVGAAVYALVREGLISGLTADSFGPDEPISAASYVTMICRQRGVRPAAAGSGEEAGYMQAALAAGWYDWDQIPPDDPERFTQPISRELGANIVVSAYFGRDVSYDYNKESAKLSDFAKLGGRYYFGVLGGLARGIFDHVSGTPFHPLENLTRGDACLWVLNASRQAAAPDPAQSPDSALPSSPAAGGVQQNGWLRVDGVQLVNENGQPVVLRGMSSHGIQWFPQYTSYRSIENTAARGASVFRVAMYVEQGGYMQHPDLMKQRVLEAVENAVKAGVYVIIDWHILEDGNPLTHADAAAAFFDEMSRRYAETPNVIYEICNEPNGNITWSGDVKPYAERMVRTIRANSPSGIILIGSPTWDQDVDQAAADPVAGTNLMYTLHFYAGTHHQALREKADRALALGAPIFVSEWGTSAADGSGGVFFESSDQWLRWMDEHSISWCNWSLCDKDETSAALRPGTPADIVWTNDNLSASGRYVFARFGRSAGTGHAGVITAAQAVAQFSPGPGQQAVIRKDGSVLAPDDPVSTGCTLSVVGASGQPRQYTVIVMGDVLGTGQITIAQLVAVARALTGQQTLAGPYLAAADFNSAGHLSIADLVQEARLLTTPSILSCRFEAAQ